MKVTTSLRKMCKQCQKVRRKGKNYIVCKAVSEADCASFPMFRRDCVSALRVLYFALCCLCCVMCAVNVLRFREEFCVSCACGLRVLLRGLFVCVAFARACVFG